MKFSNMNEFLRRLIPLSIYDWMKRMRYQKEINQENKYQNNKLLHFSSAFNKDKNTALATLTIVSHVLEKGITMPNRRYGFGFERVRDIISRCNEIIERYGHNYVELQAALADLKQYLDIHKTANYELPKDISEGIEKLVPYLKINDGNCFTTTKGDFFKLASDFEDFAKSRHSVRWYADTPVDEDKLMSAISLAQTAPSACNRQATRVKIVSTPEQKRLCYTLQNGNRGFGDKADKWLLITSELGDWSHNYRFDPYLDAGIFTMNLLYALHYYGIVACTLNAHLSTEQRDELQKKLGYPESEVPVVFIAIGNPMDEFMVPKSRHLNTKDIVQMI